MFEEDKHKNQEFPKVTVCIAVLIVFVAIYFSEELWDFFRFKVRTLVGISSCDSQKGKPQQIPPTIPKFHWENTGIVTLWFDDGWETQYTNAYKIMQPENLKGAISVTTNFVCRYQFVTWDELRLMQNNGWETTAHSVSHKCDLQYYNKDTTQYELVGSKKIIEAHGLRADQFVMPCGQDEDTLLDLFGDKTPPILEITKQNFQSYRTTKTKRINHLPILDPYNLKSFQIRNNTTLEDIKAAIADAKTQKGWLILVFHQIDDSGRFLSIPPDQFKQIIDLVKNSGLPVLLPSQVLAIK